MASSKRRWPPPRNAGSDPLECHSLAGVDISTNNTSGPNLKKIPSRAALARRWPSGRRAGKTRTMAVLGAYLAALDASGAKGDDVESLLAFLEKGRATQ